MDSVSSRRPSLLEALLKRDSFLVVFSIAGIAVLAWSYLVLEARKMNMPMSPEEMAAMALPTTPTDHFFLFAMWTIMMIGMMLPSATPMILLFNAVLRKNKSWSSTFTGTTVFVFGYVLVWGGFSGIATLLQSQLHRASLLSPMMVSTSPIFGGALLIAAGIYQWTSLKNACLGKCRSPLEFVLSHWQIGIRGALNMGLKHGAYCLGCCWLLMCLLFVGGVMNLLWVAGLSVFLMVEKLVPGGIWVGRIAGTVLVAGGIYMITHSAL